MTKGYTIDCDYIIKVKEYLPDDFEVMEMPIISVNTGLWDS